MSATVTGHRITIIQWRPPSTEGVNMSEPRYAAARLVAISMLAITLGGCVVAAAPPPRRYYAGPAVVIAPPPVRVETYGPPPEPGFIWATGYWRWEGGQHVWVP